MSLTLSRNNVRALYAYAVTHDDGRVLGYIRQGRRDGSVCYLWSADNAPSTQRKSWHDLGPVTNFSSIRAAAESYLSTLDPTLGAMPDSERKAILTREANNPARHPMARQAYAEMAAKIPDAPEDITRVAFRVFPEGDVIALFPDIVEGRGLISSYQHVGQHGGASVELVEELRPATVEESADLRRELERAPYHYRFADYDPPAPPSTPQPAPDAPAPAGAPAAVEAEPFACLTPGEAAGYLKTEPPTPVAILDEQGGAVPAFRVRFLAPGHGYAAGDVSWFGKGSSVVKVNPTDDLFARLVKADATLAGWAAKLADPSKFQPIMRAEHDRAFDRREALAGKARAADPVRFARVYPGQAFAMRHLLPAAMAARLEAAETDAEIVAALRDPAGPVYHALTVDALRLYQSCAKANLRRIPDADADQEFAGADEFTASEGITVDAVTMMRNFTRELCAQLLTKAREIRAGMRAAAGQWQGEYAPMALARVQERIWLYREDRRSFLAAAARAAASAPSEAAGEASEGDASEGDAPDGAPVVDTVTLPTAWAGYLINGDASGLNDGEDALIAEHLTRALPADAAIVDVVEGSERFTWSFDLYGGDAKGGDVADYTVLRPSIRAAAQRAAMVPQPTQQQQARAAGPVRDQFGGSYPDPKAWLAEQFEFERCAECGGDAPHHTAVPLMGNWFARCDHAPGPDGEPHPIIRAFLAASCDGPGA